ncbi:hypothetical protein MMYC01_210244 [Madurella mycetomatis]|uniref:Uncharacterized protein n=1 Tax=Madurella mycetomatis TaxID=100816 RepID=A0A175VQ83_9PEZI|nr:hypothetical protein MMYC01_210244 [Madurella mycetomatis]
MLLLVAPSLLAATVYMTLGRIADALLKGVEVRSGRRPVGCDTRGCCGQCCYSCCCTCSPTKGFLIADVVAIFTQLIGTVLPASGTLEAQRLSRIIVLIGLLVQLLVLAVFITLCTRLHVRRHRDPTESTAMIADSRIAWLRHSLCSRSQQ